MTIVQMMVRKKLQVVLIYQIIVAIEGLDEYYEDYSSEQTVRPHAMLVEYAKVLTAYLNLLVEETQDCFNGEYIYKDNKNRDTNLYNTIKQKYNLAYSD